MSEQPTLEAAYGKTLCALGEKHKKLVVLDADCARATGSVAFTETFPMRFYQMGIAQQDMRGTAAGLSLDGKIAFASSYAAFLTRAWEQIRNTVARASLPVRIVGTGAGFASAAEGSTRQCFEDVAIFRAMPQMQVFCPADGKELDEVLSHLAEDLSLPAYIRLGRSPKETMTKDVSFTPGKASRLREGSDVTIIANGFMVQRALEAAEILAQDKIEARVLNFSSVKPFDEEAIIKAATETKGIVTAEEHSVIGGLGSLVAEVLCQKAKGPLRMVGVADTFTESGSTEDLDERYGLTKEALVKAAREVLETQS